MSGEIEIIEGYIKKYRLPYMAHPYINGMNRSFDIIKEFVTNFSYIDLMGKSGIEELFLRFELKIHNNHNINRTRYAFEWPHDQDTYINIRSECKKYVCINEREIVSKFMGMVVGRKELFAIKYHLI